MAENFPWQCNTSEFAQYNPRKWRRAPAPGNALKHAGSLGLGASNNVCIDGKLVPQFYLIGAQKSATSSFASELRRSSKSVVLPEMSSWTNSQRLLFSKELHFFDSTHRWQKGKQFWLSHWPQCPSTHMVSADFTPSYLSTWEAPMRIKQMYQFQSTRLAFLIILREPIARMQSSYYHGISSGWVSKEYGSFQQYVQAALQKFNQKSYRKFHDCAQSENLGLNFGGNSGVPFSLSLYLDQIKHWTDNFNAQQFLISPMRAYIKPKPGQKYTLVKTVLKWHGLDLNAGMPAMQVKPKKPPRLNVHKHPSVAQDLTPDTYIRLKQIFNVATGPHKLANMLSPLMQKGLVLFGYTGPASSKGWIARYIVNHW